MEAKNLDRSFEKIDEYWAPRVICSIEDFYLKIAKISGEFTWHTHENEDELFIIHRGQMVLEIEDEKVGLKQGDVFLVQKGKRHRPVAKEECEIILLEKKTTAHTGDVVTAHTRSIEDQLRSI